MQIDDPIANTRGRMHRMDDVTGTTTFAYTEFGELDIETRSINGVGDDSEVFVIDYDYNAAGNIEKITLPDLRTVEYTFDAVGRVESVKTTFNGTTRTLVSNVAYKPFGPMTSGPTATASCRPSPTTSNMSPETAPRTHPHLLPPTGPWAMMRAQSRLVAAGVF